MLIGVLKESHAGEKRVATTPEVVTHLKKLGYSVAIEAGAGKAAQFLDKDYVEAGAEVIKDAVKIYQSADIILKVREPQTDEVALLKEGTILICFLAPAQSPELLQTLAGRNITALAVESVPRISRAQKMDALSSMANIAGYRAVIEAAQRFGRFFTGQITAAGKIPPA